MKIIRALSCVLLFALLNTALADGLEMPTVQEKNEVFNGNQGIESDGIEVYSLPTDLESLEGFYDELSFRLGEILPDVELEIEQPEAQSADGEQTGSLETSAIVDATTETVYFEGHGYRIFNEALTWTEAKAACEAKGGHLATITGKGENYFVKSLIEANPAKDKYHFWLGGTDAAEEGTWRWITGEAWNYSAWASGQPNNSKEHDPEGQDYLEIYRLPDYGCQWNDEPNDGYSPYSPEGPDYYSLPYYGYVCEWDGERDESPCGKLQSYKGNRYQVFNAAMTWKQAKEACEKAGGHLVVITSEDENSFIKKLILSNPASGKYHYWIGGSDSEKEGVWQWVTGEPWDYTCWEPDQPNNDTAHDSTGQDYLEFNNIPGHVQTWNDEPNDGYSPYSPEAPDYYSEPYYGYVCEWEGEAKSLKKAVVTPGYTETVYNGKAKKPSVTVKLDGKTLKKGTDYSVSYKNNTNIGTATVKVTGIGRYKGSASATFRIVPATPKLTANITKLGGISMRVNSVKGVTGYEYCLTNKENGKKKTYKTGKKVNVVKKPVQGATYAIQVRAYKKLSNKFIYGDYSELKEVRVPVYRALLIGQNAYPKDGVDIPLHYCIQNAKKLKAILTSLGGNQYQSKNCKVQTNRTRSEMIDDIGRYLGSAQEGDVSLFYYSGHGMDGAGSKSHGGLNGVDGFPLQPHVLAEELGKVKGTVIVILDSCHSGAHIEAGFLDDPRFIVITAAKASQNAAGGTISGYKASLFMYFLAEGLGCGYTSGSGRGYDKVPADDSGDGKITLLELARYINKQVEKYKKKNPDAEVDQTVQFSPRSGTIIFRRE